MTLPFLTPLLPPMGLSCLKSYLRKHGYPVKTVDVMVEVEIRQLCYRYFDILQEYIPVNKRGYFFNVGLDVLNNHLMAYMNHGEGNGDEDKYIELVKLLVYRNFYVSIDSSQVRELDSMVMAFYHRLEQYLLRLIQEEKPSIVGFSVFRGTLAPSLFAAKLVKGRLPGTTILVGGPIFSQDLFPGTPNFEIFEKRAPYIDKIFIGEGEQLLLEYLRGRLPGNQRVYTLKDINHELVNLDSLDIPDFSDFDLSAYPLLGAFTSRGCVYKCSFCAETLFWKKYNRKSTENIADQLVRLSQKYGRNAFVLTDCLINPLVTEVSKELMARNLRLYWDVTLKVDKHTCDPEYTMLWRRGGLYRVRLGIESGSQRLLNLIDKKITIEQIKASLIHLAASGIKTTAYWIAGHPGETEDDFQQTLDLIEELQDYIYDAECNPFRFFYSGQVNADVWQDKQLLYPEDNKGWLLTQTWVLNENPPREVIYERVCQLREHCKKLGIPNPYSISEINEADKRWKCLHKNAVPPLLELNQKGSAVEDTDRALLVTAHDSQKEDDADFNF
jgi:radical SAM superfamily enzyme YgiQ (UPF0313 family)